MDWIDILSIYLFFFWINILEMFIKIISICGDDDIYHNSCSALKFFKYLFILDALGVSWGGHDLVP